MASNCEKQCLECWGEYAFFGNSMYGANRQSYEIPTPSAIVGIFEAIYWRPCFKWIPDEIQIMRPTKYMTFMRNELRSITCGSQKNVYHTEMVRGNDPERVQRWDKILRDVRYRFIAHIDYNPALEKEQGRGYRKHIEIFERRAKAGQCFHQPFFGSKEFPANFRWIDLHDQKEWLSPDSLYEPKQRGLMHFGFDRSEFNGKPVPLDYIPYVNGGRVFISASSCRVHCDSEPSSKPMTDECQPRRSLWEAVKCVDGDTGRQKVKHKRNK